MHMACVRQISGSNLDLATGYPGWFFFCMFTCYFQAAAVCCVEVCSSFFPPLSLPASQSLVVEHDRIHLLLIRRFHSLHILINSVTRIAWIFSPCFFVFQVAVFQQFSPPKLCVHFFPYTYPARHMHLDFTVLILHYCLFVYLYHNVRKRRYQCLKIFLHFIYRRHKYFPENVSVTTFITINLFRKDFWFSRRCLWRMLSSGTWRFVIW